MKIGFRKSIWIIKFNWLTDCLFLFAIPDYDVVKVVRKMFDYTFSG